MIALMPGSLRTGAYNRLLAIWLHKQMPDRADMLWIDQVSVFSQDYEVPDREPRSGGAATMRHKMREADGLIVFSPEYHHLPSGGVINALNWLSRPPAEPLYGKPVGLVCASTEELDPKRSIRALRIILAQMHCPVIGEEVLVPFAQDKIKGGAPDEETGKKLLALFSEVEQASLEPALI